MNGKDLLTELGNIHEKYYMEAENDPLPASPRIRRPLLLAALIALMLLLVGCAVAYVLSLQDIKMGEMQSTYDSYSYDPESGLPVEYQGKVTVQEQALSFAGMKKTPAFQAAQEWFNFTQAYDPDGKIQSSVWGNEPEFPAEYASYGLYSQEMKDKLDELLDKYDLKTKGAVVPFRTNKQLLRAMGLETILNSNAEGEIRIHQAEYFENGNLDVIFFLDLPGETGTEIQMSTFCCLYYRQKDCLISDYATIGAEDDWKEWNYTTASGDKVLVVRHSDSYVWVFSDMGSYTATLRLESNLTDQQVEQIADSIDFSLKPRLLDGYQNFDDGAVGSGEEINGYNVTLKSAQTDGYSINILLSITAPEGVNLEKAYSGGLDLHFISPRISGYNGSESSIDDEDGLDNTKDILIRRSYTADDGSVPISKDTVLNVYFEDLYNQYYEDGREHSELISEGVWCFDVTFEDSDFREIELLSQPITAKACVGWDMEGNDVIKEFEITSIKIRSMSIQCTSENKNSDFFSINGVSSYAVMKDGSKVEIMNKEFIQPIDLDQVDHILLADGTKIPVPQ